MLRILVGSETDTLGTSSTSSTLTQYRPIQICWPTLQRRLVRHWRASSDHRSDHRSDQLSNHLSTRSLTPRVNNSPLQTLESLDPTFTRDYKSQYRSEGVRQHWSPPDSTTLWPEHRKHSSSPPPPPPPSPVTNIASMSQTWAAVVVFVIFTLNIGKWLIASETLGNSAL